MTKLRSRSVTALAAGGACLWLACTGDDPQTTSTEGDEGQPCFANGTCHAELSCVAGRCRGAADGGGGGDAPPNGGDDNGSGTEDGGDDDGGGGGGPDACVVPTYGDGPRCGESSCAEGVTCCLASGQCEDDATCPAKWTCETRSQCPMAGPNCCIEGDLQAGGDLCERSLLGATSSCTEKPKCNNSNQFITCTASDECGTNPCVPVEVHVQGGQTLVVKICKP